MRPKVCYVSSPYPSFVRMANLYSNLIQSQCDLLSLADVEHADIVILHFRPHHYEKLFEVYPALSGKYVIGCAAWEATELPRCYQTSLSLVQEVWTNSQYCFDVFNKYHKNVVYMPCIIERDTACSEEDRRFIKGIIDYDDDFTYFLSIASTRDKRKNTSSLVDVFRANRCLMPKAKLIIKARQDDRPSIEVHSGIVYVTAQLTCSQINALYELSDVYTSLHHAEGWGLTMSDAMIFGKPVIATKYSGNLEYMNDDNSFLIESSERNIGPEDCFDLFDSEMKWGYPDLKSAGDALVALYNDPVGQAASSKVHQGLQDICRFNLDSVKVTLLGRLETICSNMM